MRITTQRGVEDLTPDSPLRTLVVGAGESGRAVSGDLAAAPGYGLEPVGFLDDDPAAALVTDLPVLGTLDHLAEVALREDVDVVVVAIPSLDPETFRRLSREASAVGARVQYLPSLVTALGRRAVGSDLRRLDLGLLGPRDARVVTRSAARTVRDKSVLVVGPGGAVGRELCRQVLGLGPSRLSILDHDEVTLRRLQVELGGGALLDHDDLWAVDVRDRGGVDRAVAEVRPDVVFHAALHGPTLRPGDHTCDTVRSVVVGTQNVLQAAVAQTAERFVLVSTGQAADIGSVRGAACRLAEQVVEHGHGRGTRCASVRVGDILGRRGSLLPLLAAQVSSGRPVNVGHPEMTRFLMTIEEAAGRVVEAAHLAGGGETFVLLSDPVRVLDVVEAFAHLMNRVDVEIRFTGSGPGQRLHEQLLGEHEELRPTAHPAIARVAATPAARDFRRTLRALCRDAERGDGDAVRSRLRHLVPGPLPHAPTVPTQAAAPHMDDR